MTGLLVSLNINNREDHGVKDFKRKLKDSLERRLGGKEMLERYCVATLLDPRYFIETIWTFLLTIVISPNFLLETL